MHRAGREGWGKTGIAIAEGATRTVDLTENRPWVGIDDIGVRPDIQPNRAVTGQGIDRDAIGAVRLTRGRYTCNFGHAGNGAARRSGRGQYEVTGCDRVASGQIGVEHPFVERHDEVDSGRRAGGGSLQHDGKHARRTWACTWAIAAKRIAVDSAIG